MNGEQAVENFLSRLPQEKVASKTPERNDSNRFFWMTNKAGNLVPVPEHLAVAKLAKGYQHTDGKLTSEDPQDRVRPARRKSEKGQLADAMGMLAETIKGGAVTPKTETKELTADEARFEELKTKRAWTNPETKEEYAELKAKLGK